MMSERKRKQKWSLNPRGKDWSENSNKFGQKLMEKMGWSTGKGLGAKEDGMTEHIRVAYKNDTQGMGYKERDDQWTEHESNFTQLLNTLVGPKDDKVDEKGSELKVESLEKKSQVSKARVHYHKFTRGKDLTRYSKKDLANIFGKKNLEDLSKSQNVEAEKVDEKENEKDKTFGVVTLNGGNMLDYFKNKLPNFKNSTPKTHSDPESDSERPSFGFGFTQKEEKCGGNEDSSENSNNRNKKKRNKDHVDNFRKPCFGLGYDRYNGEESKSKNEYSSFVKATETIEQKEPLKFGIKFNGANKTEENISNKKRKKQNKTESVDEDEEANKIKKIKTLEIDTVDGNNDEVGLKKKKKKKKIEPSFVSFIAETSESTDDKKKKNKSKKEDDVIAPVEDETNKVLNGSPLEKKKKNKRSLIENDNEAAGESIVEEIVSSKKGKKRKSESETDTAFTPMKKKFKNFEDLHSLQDEAKITQTPDKEFKKKKNKTKSKNCSEENEHTNGLANPAFDPLYKEIILEKHNLDAIVEEPENLIDSPVDKSGDGAEEMDTSLQRKSEKKVKKKKSKAKVGIDNPCLEEMSTENEIVGEVEASISEQNKDDTPSKSKKKKNKQLLSIENPCFNMDDSVGSEVNPNKYEVKRSKKEKNMGIINPGLDLTSPPPPDNEKSSVAEELPILEDTLMLNVVCTPVLKKDSNRKLQRRKSVRFSDVNQSIFINNMDSPADLRKNGEGGLDNAAYDQFGNRIEENIDSLSKQLDDYQAEVENDLNEAKMQVMVGEVGDPEGDNEILPSGEVKLKFKYANFGRMPPWMKRTNGMNPKSSYRHLIKGDIVLGFKNTNMHDIKGYGEHLKASCT